MAKKAQVQADMIKVVAASMEQMLSQAAISTVELEKVKADREVRLAEALGVDGYLTLRREEREAAAAQSAAALQALVPVLGQGLALLEGLKDIEAKRAEADAAAKTERKELYKELQKVVREGAYKSVRVTDYGTLELTQAAK
jgi:hypothetical protein